MEELALAVSDAGRDPVPDLSTSMGTPYGEQERFTGEITSSPSGRNLQVTCREAIFQD